MSNASKTISPQELAQKQSKNQPVFLLDVREPHEADLCMIPDSVLVPLCQLPARLDELPGDREIVVYCHHGRRSQQAIDYLISQGYGDLYNLTGGIDGWAVFVDPGMTRY